MGALTLAAALTAPAFACKFCRPGGEYDRYTPDDPMSAFAPDAATIARGQEAGSPPTAAPAAPKPEDLVTSRAALTAAMASAPAPAPDSPAPTAGSYRERLLRPVSYSPPAAAATVPAATPSAGLSVSAARVVDGTLVLAVLGVIGFFVRRS